MLFVVERRRSRRLSGAIRAERALASEAIKTVSRLPEQPECRRPW